MQADPEKREKMWAISAALILIGCANFAMAMKEAGVIHVSGKVVCQDCTKSWKEWANGDRPIKGSKVSLTCTDERGRVMHYASDTTDEKGQFDIIVRKYRNNGKKLNEKFCKVRLLSSSDATCDVLTDFGKGKSGVCLKRPTTVYRDTAKYMVGPFFYTSPMCQRPGTDQPQEGGGSPEGGH